MRAAIFFASDGLRRAVRKFPRARRVKALRRTQKGGTGRKRGRSGKQREMKREAEGDETGSKG